MLYLKEKNVFDFFQSVLEIYTIILDSYLSRND